MYEELYTNITDEQRSIRDMAHRFAKEVLRPAANELDKLKAEEVVKRIPSGTDRVAGLELGSVPIAAVVSVIADIPMLIVRKEKKGYGTGNQVEGALKEGETVLIIEDTTTTGGQIVKAINAIREAGGVVNYAVVVVNRQEGSDESVANEKVELMSIIKASELVRPDE